MERTVCKNPWCKATFEYKDEDMIEVEGIDGKVPPHQCPKCRSFNDDLSSGITWKDKKYEGSRFDGMPHHISIKINKYF